MNNEEKTVRSLQTGSVALLVIAAWYVISTWFEWFFRYGMTP